MFDGSVKEELHGCDTKCCLLFEMLIRDRPFNLKRGYGFLFRSEFFFRTSRVRILIFFVAQSGNFFFQTLTLDYMTKTLNQIIFFPPPKSEYCFQQHLESEYFLRKKIINPPPTPFKLNGRSLRYDLFYTKN